MVPDGLVRHKIWRGIHTDEAAEPNAFAVDAAVAAFTKGEMWLDELREYIYQNKKLASEYLENEVPQIRAVPSQATYLLWLDCIRLSGDSSEASSFIREKTGLYLSAGRQFGGNGRGFIRMNIACPREVLEDGLGRLKQGFMAYEEWSAGLC